MEAQFRCNGSDAFVSWINNTLGIKRTANVIWDRQEEFDFKVFSSPVDLENAIREKVKRGFTGRVTAGFCWDWSLPDENGKLINDVIIGDYKRPWDAKPEAKRLAPGIPKASLWAYDPNGIDQVGCVYTAQGFEFDYVGVIFGEDVVYDFDKQEWVGDYKKSSDSVVKRSKDKFVELVKNTYRVLLSRGMKGCYVYFMNKDTERFFKSRIEGDSSYQDKPITVSQVLNGEVDFLERILEEVDNNLKYKEYLPVYTLKAAAGAFGEGMDVKEMGWIKVNIGRSLDKRLFVTEMRVVTVHADEEPILAASGCTRDFVLIDVCRDGPSKGSLSEISKIPIGQDGDLDVSDLEWTAIEPTLLAGQRRLGETINQRHLFDAILQKVNFGTSWRTLVPKSSSGNNARFAERSWSSRATLLPSLEILRNLRN